MLISLIYVFYVKQIEVEAIVYVLLANLMTVLTNIVKIAETNVRNVFYKPKIVLFVEEIDFKHLYAHAQMDPTMILKA